MANGVEPKFEENETKDIIVRGAHIELAQSGEVSFHGVRFCQQSLHDGAAFQCMRLYQCQKDIFLALELGVNRSFGPACKLRDLEKIGLLIPVADEHLL